MSWPSARQLVASLVIAVLLLSFAVALWPEPKARILTSPQQWSLSEKIGATPLATYPRQYRQVRASIADAPEATLYRTWTPESGTQPGRISFGPFRAEGLISVVISGNSVIPSGKAQMHVFCTAHNERLPISRGSVNVNASEALVHIPRECGAEDLRVELVTADACLAGVGPIAALSRLSGWKQSFLGVLPYLLISLFAYSAIGFGGALTLRKWCQAELAAAITIGLTFLATFFSYGFASPSIARLVPLAVAVLLLVAIVRAAPEDRRRTASALASAALAWWGAALFGFILLSLTYNGNGHWEPNNRFFPATWSSDNELPWIFAEALRRGDDLRTLFGPEWLPSDRPPLMTGGHLLIADVFSLMQRSGNDGDYLRGMAYNAAAIAQNALWAPAMLYLLTATLRLSARRALQLTAVMTLIPFFLFNTIYGWPKLLGAAFGILATAAACSIARRSRTEPTSAEALLTGTFCSLSVLAHASNLFYLVPLAAWLLVRGLWRTPKALVVMAAFGLILVTPWFCYQRFVLPSRDPLAKYALAGTFGLGHPDKNLAACIRERYAGLSPGEWLSIKAKLLVSPLLTVTTGIADVQPVSWARTNLAATLREWDFFYLSAGNLPILMGLLLILAPRLIGTSLTPEMTETHSTARAIACIVGAAYGLIVLTCFPSLIIPVLPYSLLSVLAAASMAMLDLNRRLMLFCTVACGLYVGVVWILASLFDALNVDSVAACFFAVVLLAPVVIRLWQHQVHSQSDEPLAQ